MLIDLQRKALKVMVGAAIKLAGGQENAVNVSSRITRHATFSDYGNTLLLERQCPIDVAVEIDQFNGRPLIIRKAAELLGYALVPLPGDKAAGSSVGALCRVTKETSEALAAISDYVDNGGTPKPDMVRKTCSEIDDAVEALLAVRHRLAPPATIEGGAE